MNAWKRRPDIASLAQKKDIPALIRALGHPDPGIQWKAAEAVGKLGVVATPYLIEALGKRNVDVRLGAIEALGDIRDPAAVTPLITLLSEEKNEEIRWAAVLTLGEIADPVALNSLVKSLFDPNKYVRYGAALALDKLGWTPADGEEKTRYLIALQKWEQVHECGNEALEPLVCSVSDADSRIRVKAIETIGELGIPEAENVCDRALADPNSEVRWRAFISLPRCGLPLSHITRGLTRRPHTRHNPVIAAFLNFFFPGIGYNYLGKWYGFFLFQINLAVIVILSLMLGPILPYVISYSFGSLVSVHAWSMAKSLPDLS